MGRIIGILLLLAVFAGADYIVDQPDAARGKDVGLRYNSDINSGGGATLNVYVNSLDNRYTTLIQFDTLDAIPAGSTIDSAKITYTHSSSGGSTILNTSCLLRAWIESEARYSEWSTGNSWTIPGALGIGTDITAVLDSQVHATTTTVVYVTNSTQYIVDNDNFGFFHWFSSSGATVYYYPYSSDDWNPSRHPKLEVWFTEGAGDVSKPKNYIINRNGKIEYYRR